VVKKIAVIASFNLIERTRSYNSISTFVKAIIRIRECSSLADIERFKLAESIASISI
jgi:hypothetical protein